jgi:ribulose 1,5-bisphosphate synthetase/thiazole synthase
VCKTELVERCHEECEQTGGAIFCGGQFINATDVQACADEIEAEFSIHVEVCSSSMPSPTAVASSTAPWTPSGVSAGCYWPSACSA